MVEFRTQKGRTQPRPYAKETPYRKEGSYDHENNYSDKDDVMGEIALWEGKRGSVVWQGLVKFKDGTKYNVSLFHPNSEYSKALYTGNLSVNAGAGWETVAYVDFYKSKSDKVKAVGFIKIKGDQEASYRVLLFKNDNPKGLENAPKFKGMVIENVRNTEDDKPVSSKSKPTSNPHYSSDAF